MTLEDLKSSEGWCLATGEKALASQVQTFSQTKPLEDPWTLLYLKEGQRIVAAAVGILGDRDRAIDWFCHAKLVPFGDLTPRVLLSLGRSEDVLQALRVIQVGSYQAALQRRPRRSARPVLFLDFGDVICLDLKGVFDVMHQNYREDRAIEALASDGSLIWPKLFDPHAVGYLHAVQEEFRPQIVLTTSLRRVFSEEALAHILDLCGLGFVVENLHADAYTKWQPNESSRWSEIQQWLGDHPEYMENFVVLDDTFSGVAFIASVRMLATEELQDHYEPYVVLCEKDKGLMNVEFQMLRGAFLTRREVHRRDFEESQMKWAALQNDLIERAGRKVPSSGENSGPGSCS